MKVAVAFDHRGVHLRDAILGALGDTGHEPLDLGADTDAVVIDYPDKAREIGGVVRSGDAERGVLVCGSGVGAAVAACKVRGIRAARGTAPPPGSSVAGTSTGTPPPRRGCS